MPANDFMMLPRCLMWCAVGVVWMLMPVACRRSAENADSMAHVYDALNATGEGRMAEGLGLEELMVLAKSRSSELGFAVGETVPDDRLTSPDFRSVSPMVDAALRFPLSQDGASGTLAIWSIVRKREYLPRVVVHVAEWLEQAGGPGRFHLRGWYLAFLVPDTGWSSMDETQAFLDSVMRD